MPLVISAKAAAQLLGRVDVLKVLKPRPRAPNRFAVVEDAEVQQRLSSDTSAFDATADVVSGGEDERISADCAVACAHRCDPPARGLDGLHRAFYCRQADRLLESPAVRRWRRRKQLE